MRVLSLNVGRPRIVRDGDREVLTGIFKAPVEGPVLLRRLNLDGDQQADLTGPRRPGQGALRLPVRAL